MSLETRQLGPLSFKIADQAQEFEAIHGLNYRTFVDEIPQHQSNPEQRLVDRFHAQNTYAICLHQGELVGMIAGRCERPFSLDGKLSDLQQHLPPHQRAVEVRLLAVAPAFRKHAVFARLAGVLARYFRAQGCDLALISGTLRQTKLYAHLGFQAFGPLVGSAEAPYQPMLMRLPDYAAKSGHLEFLSDGQHASFLPGPVTIAPAVAQALAAPALSHRGAVHLQRLARVRQRLCELGHCEGALVFPGTGTLANDAVAGQLSLLGGRGLVFSNGEFGERLADHAQRWRLPHQLMRLPWGQALSAAALEQALAEQRPDWVWVVLSETSTGMLNPLELLREACARFGSRLCVDAVSAFGLQPVDLRGVWLASAVSGKALGSYAGLAIVMHNGDLQPAGALPRAIDLGGFAQADGVPYTQSSNLLAALEAALAVDWPARWQAVREADAALRLALAADADDEAWRLLVDGPHAMPGILTLALAPSLRVGRIGQRLERAGFKLAWQSSYLHERNWLQICLMGAWSEAALALLPQRLRLAAGAV
jgi:aspartate aminotransferase-like enzyme/GNAT superfamily N-acetyltransferase